MRIKMLPMVTFYSTTIVDFGFENSKFSILG